MAYLDDLYTARDAYAAKLAEGPPPSGVTSYSIDGESYTITYAQLVDALIKIEDLIVRALNRAGHRRDLRLIRGWRGWYAPR